MASLQEEGKKITEQLGHGVVYKGPWLPYGPSGKFYGHFFEDAAVTRSSFVASTLEEAKEALTEMRKSFGAELPVFPDNPIGTCYEDAWRFLIKEEEGELIHGTVESLGRRVGHAWVELPTSFIWEPESRQFIKKADFQAMAKPQEEARYSATEAAIMLARVGKHGPWTEEEQQILKEGNPDNTWTCPQCDRINQIYPYPTRCSRCGYLRETEPESGILELEDVGREWDKLTKLQRQPIVERANLPSTFALRDWEQLPLSKKDAIRMSFREIPNTEAGNPIRVRFDRASIDSAITAAKRLQSEKDLYIFATYLGFTIESRPPPGMQQYVVVHPDGTTETVKPLGGNPVSMYRFVAELPEFRGTAWRAESGYWHDPGTTVADIIRFEQDELGNEYPDVSDELLKDLDRFSASDAVWVNRRRKDCLFYLSEGESEEAVGRVHLGEGAKIVSPDYCGGFLVLRGGAEPMLEKGGNPIPEELDLARTLAIIDSRPKGRIIESKLREEFGDAVIDALRQGRYVVSGSAGYNPPLLVSLKGRELIQGGNPMKKLISEEEAIGMLERLSMTPDEAKRSLFGSEEEGRTIMKAVQARVKREQNKWAPMDPREGPPLPRIFAGLRWPWRKP